MKKINLASLLIFVFAIFVIGCATTDTQVKDSWRNLNSANEIIGRWEGSTSALIPEDKANHIPRSSIGLNVTLQYLRGAGNLDISYKLDLDRMITDMLKTDAMRQAGVTKDQLWGILLNEIQSADKTGVFSDYGKYYLIVTERPGIDNLSNCFINEKGNSFKIVFPDVLSFGLGDQGITEIILIKK